MAGPKKVTQEEYDELRSKLEDKYNYDEMSDEEKERFDATMDQVAVVGDKTDEADEGDAADDEEVEKGEFEDGHPQGHEIDDGDEDVR